MDHRFVLVAERHFAGWFGGGGKDSALLQINHERIYQHGDVNDAE